MRLFTFLLLSFLPVHVYAYTVNTTADTSDVDLGDGLCIDEDGRCSLRAAIEEANADLSTKDMIILPAGTYALTQSPLEIMSSLDLLGDRAGDTIVDGSRMNRVFEVVTSGSIDVTLSNITLRNGHGEEENGGGIYVAHKGKVALRLSSVIITNNAADSGGGIYFENCEGMLTLHDSLISNNRAVTSSTGKGGGGINVFCGTVEINNSTLTGNKAAEVGGALKVGLGGLVKIYSTTITQNRAQGEGGGGIYSDPDFVMTTLQNTILADNKHPQSPDCGGGKIISEGHNLIGNAHGCSFSGTRGINGDQVGTNTATLNPGLEELLDDGDRIPTHALLMGSLAIDAGPSTVYPDGCRDAQGKILASDQRGKNRYVDGDGDGKVVCDIGAFEFSLGKPTDYDADGFSDFVGDCHDANTDIHPGAMELCDGVDNDCDGKKDEGFDDLGGDCTVDMGAYSIPGKQVCSEDGLSLTCQPLREVPRSFSLSTLSSRHRMKY